MRIGEFLIEKGILIEEDISTILSFSRQTGLRFVEAGLHLKILTRDSLVKAFAPGCKNQLFDLSPAFIEKAPRGVFTTEDMLKYGILPLGLKKEYRFLQASRRKQLVLGMLDPTTEISKKNNDRRRKGTKGMEKLRSKTDRRGGAAASKPFVYLILVDQFIEMMTLVYGVTAEEIQRCDPNNIHPILRDFLHVGEVTDVTKIAA